MRNVFNLTQMIHWKWVACLHVRREIIINLYSAPVIYTSKMKIHLMWFRIIQYTVAVIYKLKSDLRKSFFNQHFKYLNYRIPYLIAILKCYINIFLTHHQSIEHYNPKCNWLPYIFLSQKHLKIFIQIIWNNFRYIFLLFIYPLYV